MSQSPSYNYCAVPLASYAVRADQSQGRLFNEAECDTRTCFQRDRDRVIHASAFRRLKYKTQVFVYSHGDNYRTRLTHTLEVAQIARTLARALYLNEDLAEVIALSHDLGHPPFAHSGEEALIELMQDYGGFDHNDQSLRVVTELEEKYPQWNGLNLTWETLEGIVKHNGPVENTTLPFMLQKIQEETDLRLGTYASLEAQVAAIADDIAYNNHDVEDGLRAGLLTLDQLVEHVPLMKQIVEENRKAWPDLNDQRFNAQIIRDMIGIMVRDVLEETKARLTNNKIETLEQVRGANSQMVAFSDELFKRVQELRKFLYNHMYKHYTVNRMCRKAEAIIGDLFDVFMDRPECLPDEWQGKIAVQSGDQTHAARIICDYIAGMTDRYAKLEHERLFDIKG